MEEIIVQENLIVANQGAKPTFQTDRGSSIIDTTLASSNAITYITRQEVDIDNENLSDHNNIFKSLQYNQPSAIMQLSFKKWKQKIDTAALQRVEEKVSEY